MLSILLLGRTGQLGFELEPILHSFGKVIAYGRKEADLEKPTQIQRILNENNPDIIVNAAAYTAVEKAETEEEKAYIVNAETPTLLADWAAHNDSWLIHYSTDYVFNGSDGPYRETDLTSPLNAYGRTKLAGEEGISACNGKFLILRTSWLFSLRRQNFLNTILNLVSKQDHLKIVDDQFGTPTWSRTLAHATTKMISQIIKSKNPDSLAGIYHVANQGKASWYGFAKWILKQTISHSPRKILIEPISTANYSSHIVRPRDTRLDTSKIKQTFGLTFITWKEAACLCLSESR